VLLQDTVDQDRPITYASHVLIHAEQNYNTTEKELAIGWTVNHFHPLFI